MARNTAAGAHGQARVDFGHALKSAPGLRDRVIEYQTVRALWDWRDQNGGEAANMHRVTQCHASDDYRLWLRFEDGVEGSVFLGNLLEVDRFGAWRDAKRFCQAAVDPAMSTVVWEDGLALDPDILYQDLLSSRNQGIQLALASQPRMNGPHPQGRALSG